MEINVEKRVINRCAKRWMNNRFVHRVEKFVKLLRKLEDKRTQVLLTSIRWIFAFFPHILGIQLLPNFGDLLTNQKV